MTVSLILDICWCLFWLTWMSLILEHISSSSSSEKDPITVSLVAFFGTVGMKLLFRGSEDVRRISNLEQYVRSSSCLFWKPDEELSRRMLMTFAWVFGWLGRVFFFLSRDLSTCDGPPSTSFSESSSEVKTNARFTLRFLIEGLSVSSRCGVA